MRDGTIEQFLTECESAILKHGTDHIVQVEIFEKDDRVAFGPFYNLDYSNLVAAPFIRIERMHLGELVEHYRAQIYAELSEKFLLENDLTEEDLKRFLDKLDKTTSSN